MTLEQINAEISSLEGKVSRAACLFCKHGGCIGTVWGGHALPWPKPVGTRAHGMRRMLLLPCVYVHGVHCTQGQELSQKLEQLQGEAPVSDEERMEIEKVGCSVCLVSRIDTGKLMGPQSPLNSHTGRLAHSGEAHTGNSREVCGARPPGHHAAAASPCALRPAPLPACTRAVSSSMASRPHVS